MGRTARERFVTSGRPRSRLVHACCLRHSHLLRKVSYPPGLASREGQGIPPSACPASSPTTGACGKVAKYLCIA